jgi:hypothetical protein
MQVLFKSASSVQHPVIACAKDKTKKFEICSPFLQHFNSVAVEEIRSARVLEKPYAENSSCLGARSVYGLLAWCLRVC